MSKLPLVDDKTLEKLVLQLGSEIERQNGSHYVFNLNMS